MEDVIPNTQIYAIEYNILTDEENLRDSSVRVMNSELFKLNKTVDEGVYDAHMGTTDFDYQCTTCANEKGKCPGHSGHIVLNYPVKDPIYREELIKWLKVICGNCGNCVSRDIPRASKPLEELIKKKIKRMSNCEYCDEPITKVKKSEHASYMFMVLKKIGDRKPEQVELNNYEIKNILDKVTDKTVKLLKPSMETHPKNLVRTILRVPPNTIRPDMKKIGGGKSNMNDTTVFLKQIVNVNNDIPATKEFDLKQVDKYNTLELTIDSYLRGSSATGDQQKFVTNNSTILTSIAQRIPGKEGHIRRFLLGKRVMMIARAVITTDPLVRIDEVGVPISIASQIQIPTTAASYNIAELSTYVINARDSFPGATHVYIQAQARKISIHKLPKEYVLKIGDIVYHDLLDGIMVLLNRQPSLGKSSIGAHRIKIVPTGLTFRLNVSACNAYGADFDGDQMHMIVCQDIQTRVEIDKLSNIGNNMISNQTASPLFGNYYDSLIGISVLTQSDTLLSKKQAMGLFAGIDIASKRIKFDKKQYSGRELFSMILPNINFSEKSASMYLPQYAQFIKYNSQDIKVKITRGKLESGIVDKATAGQGERGSIYHVIHNDYGKDVALNAIYNSHQMANSFLYYSGFTSGYNDIRISDKASEMVREKISKTIADSKAITQKLNNGTLIVPKGSAMRDFYEREQLAVLEPGSDFIEPILADIDFYTNGLACLIFRKSKGKPGNFISINAAIGSQLVGDHRPPAKLAGRTSPYFHRYEDHPISLGYVVDSWRIGIRPESYIFSCAESKHGIIANAISTMVAGAQSRILMKNTDSVITDNNRKSMKFNNVLQLLYGDNGVNICKTERVYINTAKIGNEAIKKYHMKATSFAKQFHTSGIQKLLDEEYDQICKDRNRYREIFLEMEKFNLGSSLFTNEVDSPVNPFRIIEDVIFRHERKGTLNPESAITRIRQSVKNLAYAYFNENYEQQQRRIPENILRCMELVHITIRSYLNTHYLMKHGVEDDMLTIILDTIKTTMKSSLMHSGSAVGVDCSQSLSEPLTQFVLDSKNKSGGLARAEVSILVRIKEIYSARSTTAMKSPLMTILVKEEYELDKARVQQIASYIKMMHFDSFSTMEQIFEEEFGKPVHPKYIHEKAWIADYMKYNESPPSNLIRWCIRFELARDNLFTNSIKLEKIILELTRQFPEMYFVHTPETASKIIVRVYLKSTMFKNISPSLKSMKGFLESINKCVIRGIDNIINTEVVEMIKSYVDDKGEIANKKIFVIQTTGSNLAKILENPYINRYSTQTNSILEFSSVFGIDAARHKIISELMNIMDGSLYAHCSLVADEMTFSGEVTAILKSGLAVREKENIPLRMSFQSPLEVLKVAGLENAKTKLTGISGPIVLGQIGKVGTIYNDIILNKEFVKNEMTYKQEHLEELI